MNKRFTTKILGIVALALALMIPLNMIEGVVSERSSYRESVKADIARSWTGAQKFLGPVLVVPYVERHSQKEWDKNLKKYHLTYYYRNKQIYLLPEILLINSNISTEKRKRGIYSIPVYSSNIKVTGSFNTKKLVSIYHHEGKNVTWKTPYVAMLVSDIRGITEQPRLDWEGASYDFTSGSDIESWDTGMHAKLPRLQATSPRSYGFSFQVKLNGMEQLEFAPVGKSTLVKMHADWPHPSFIGRYLPSGHQISSKGFDATWKMSSFSSDMPRLIKTCEDGNCGDFVANTFGVSLINTVDIYQQTDRSVKYAILFISLTFLIFFLFEVMKDLRLHPMQYLLVGLSLTIFYQLLISLSEHMNFALAYLIAATANIGVITVYISEILKGRKRALAFGGLLVLLYAMLFAILKSEDNALLMGSLLFFAILSLVMYVTRKVDWYQVTDKLTKPNPETEEQSK